MNYVTLCFDVFKEINSLRHNYYELGDMLEFIAGYGAKWTYEHLTREVLSCLR